jgi:hypothetical protein
MKENIEKFQSIVAETKFGTLVLGQVTVEALEKPATDEDVTVFITTLFTQPLAVWPFYREEVRQFIYKKFEFSEELQAEFEVVVKNVQHVLNKLKYQPQQ